jgi:hypothetical protein
MRMDKFAADRTIVFPQAILCIDEFSFWCGQVQDAWNEIRTRKDPARPPVFKDINAILFMGAQMNCRLMIFGQVVNYQLLGPAIESFGTKLMSGWNKQSYMRLIGITPVPVGSKARGRFLYYDSEDMHSIQVILGDDIELRKFALEGTPQATPDVIRVDSEMLVIDSPAKDVGADA